MEDLKILIATSKQELAISVNSSMSLLYWSIGKRINQEILDEKRATYGKQIIALVSGQLAIEYGSSFSEKNLRRMLQFASTFPEKEIVVSVIRQLSWTHLIALIPIEDPIKRAFYIEMCVLEKWSVRTFRERINSMLYERTAISKKSDETIVKELDLLKSERQISPDLVFKDPYFLNFLGLKDTYSEKDFETSILAELQNFIIELGSDFAFMARQKRITIDNEDYYIDLLFYHRRLKCLVAIELKLGKFEAAHKGQMELYLRWLEKHEMVSGENLPIGLILCSNKNEEHVELLQLDKSNIKIGEYLTKLPDMKLLESKLHLSIQQAKNRLIQRENQ
ncbi:PDDEXK nuclease domain-containing protein [Myroides guanonis]|nr:PDDEXK nuclease domain-containing protein [Myroides guanonis]